MLRDIIQYVQSRGGQYDRDVIVREANRAWSDIWESTDLPGSKNQMSLDDDCSCNGIPRITLPHFVQDLRAAKAHNGPRVQLNTPDLLFHDGQYTQMPLTWRFINYTPLERWTGNTAPPLLRVASKVTTEFSVTIIGSTANREKVREVITFAPGDLEQRAQNAFTGYDSITKSVLTETNIVGYDGDGNQFFTLPNSAEEARNQVWQTRDIAQWFNNDWVTCCWDILFKRTPNYLYYDEDTVLPKYEDTVQDLVVSRLLLTEKGNEDRAGVYANMAVQSLEQKAANATRGQRNMLDLGRNNYTTRYWGRL